MALNRFSALPKATIAQTQVLPDMGVLDSALSRQQKSYDETASQISKFQSQVSGLQGYGDYAQNYISKLDEDVKGFVNQISNKDLGSAEVRNGANGFIQAIASDPELKKIQKAKELREEYEKQSSELAAKNKLNPSQQYFMEKAWDAYSKHGVVSNYLSQPLQEYVDPYTETMKYFKDLQANGGDAIKFLADGTAFKNSSKGINGSRINEQAKNIFDVFKNDTIGRQYSLDYAKLVDQGAIDPKKTSEDQYLAQQLVSIGSTKKYNQSSTNMDVALRSSRKEGLEKTKEEATETSYLPAMKGKELKFPVDSNGDAIVSLTDHVVSWFTGEDATSEEKKQFNQTIEANAKASKMTKPQYLAALQADPNVKVNLWTDTKKIDSESKRFFNPKTGGGDLVTRKIYTDEYPDGIAATEFLKERGYTEDELKAGFSVIGYSSFDSPYTVRGKIGVINGEQFTIDDSFNATTEDKYKHILSKSKFSEDGTYTDILTDDTGKTYKITSRYIVGQGGVEVAREEVK